MLRDNPDPINSITVHLYPEDNGIYPGASRSIDEFMGAANEFARRARKPLFLGEFGVSAERIRQIEQVAMAKLRGSGRRLRLEGLWTN